MGFFDQLFKTANDPTGRVDPDTNTMWTLPWSWVSEDGVYYGNDGTAWLYVVLPTFPMTWEDPPEQVQFATQLHQMLVDLAATGTGGGGAMQQMIGVDREVHLVAIRWERDARAPEGTPDGLLDYMDRTFRNDEFGGRMTVPHKTVFVGIKLFRGTQTSLQQLDRQQDGVAGFVRQLQETWAKPLGESAADVKAFAPDAEQMRKVVFGGGYGARLPTPEERDQLEYWANMGRYGDSFNLESPTQVKVDGHTSWEFSAVMNFAEHQQQAPFYRWIEGAMNLAQGPDAVSVRGQLTPPEKIRTQARRTQRQMLAQIEEDQASGDLERAEFAEARQVAQEFENYIRNLDEPMITHTSMLMARKVGGPGREPYQDRMRRSFGIRIKPLYQRQLEAWAEFMPTSANRLNPFLKDVSVSMISQSGVQAHSVLGDPAGVYVGLADPDLTLTFLDPFRGSQKGKTPLTAVVGEPGAGKTWLMQMMARQANLAGIPVVYINPKGYPRETSSLEPTADLAGGRTIRLSDLTQQPGMLDPFGFADPADAARIAFQFISSVLTFDNDEHKQLDLLNGLQDAADDGVRCVGQALDYVADDDLVSLIRKQLRDPRFALICSPTPVDRGAVQDAFTLIEFDQPLEIPSPRKDPGKYEREEKLAVATMRLTTRAALYLLANRGRGGMLLVDEAWQLLGVPETEEDIERMGRLGRSQRIMTVLGTQKISDLLDKGLEQYISRTFVMAMEDRDEGTAALTLGGFEVTDSRLNLLPNLRYDDGEETGVERWARALHSDLNGRKGMVWIGPTPAQEAAAFTTTPDERIAQQEAADADVGPEGDLSGLLSDEGGEIGRPPAGEGGRSVFETTRTGSAPVDGGPADGRANT